VHARWAMLGVAGILGAEIARPDMFFYEAGRPENLPEPFTNINMGGLLAWQFCLMHFVEVRRWMDYKNFGSVNEVSSSGWYRHEAWHMWSLVQRVCACAGQPRPQQVQAQAQVQADVGCMHAEQCSVPKMASRSREQGWRPGQECLPAAGAAGGSAGCSMGAPAMQQAWMCWAAVVA
jgi:hypothetical protein